MFRALLCAAALASTLAACTDAKSSESEEPVTTTPPENGACRVLTPEAISRPSDDTETVPCKQAHTAQTFLVGTFKGGLADAAYDDKRLGAEVYDVCTRQFRRFTGADESLALRTVLSWAWFRPAEAAWDAGARWYRCDVVGGTEQSKRLVGLPKTAKGVLLGIPGDAWMACVPGDTVTGSVPVPCTEKHDWRAVTTVVVGKENQKYPGDRLVEVQSRDFCRNSVGAWMNYPIDYEYAYTWVGKAEWDAGERRSVCWAGTTE